MPNAVSKLFCQKTKVGLLVIAGSLTWILTIFKSGLNYSYGMGFWGANGHDAIWHISLAESFKKASAEMPIFAGAKIQNYHIGFDLILAILSKITSIPIHVLYFQIIPVIISFTVGILTYKFILTWTKSHTAAFYSVFFVYFGGSFGWVLGRGESAFWSQQSITTLINPPFALSLVFVLAGLIFLQKLMLKRSLVYYFLTILIFGTLAEIKVYAGVLCLGALLVSGVFLFIKERSLILIKVFLLSLALSIVLYLPFNNNAAGLLVFKPFWFLETLMGLSDRLDFQKYYSAMLTYKSGRNYIKMFPAYLIAFIIFWVGNLGTRIIKDFTIVLWLKNFKNLDWLKVCTLSIIVSGLVIPMLFLQKGTPWNTIQFFYYSLFFSSLLAGIGLAEFLRNTELNPLTGRVFIVVLFLVTIPTTIITLGNVYIPPRPPAMLSNDEIAALKFLSHQEEGVVLTKPFDELKSKEAEVNPPRPLYLYTTTAYVSAFSKHPTFLEDEINLDITGYDWKERKEKILNWYNEKDDRRTGDFLTTNKIRYIYWIKEGQSPLDLTKLGISNIFENRFVTIYKVN